MRPLVKVRRFRGKRGEAKKVKVAHTLTSDKQRQSYLRRVGKRG